MFSCSLAVSSAVPFPTRYDSSFSLNQTVAILTFKLRILILLLLLSFSERKKCQPVRIGVPG